MYKQNSRPLCKQTTATLLLAVAALNLHAEISTDGTMGAALQLTGPDYAITEDLGTRAGTNLFHSFTRFSIATGESATFSGAPEISNVIGRVTGGEVSSINGALNSTIPDADVYLVNPAGVVFGTDASIDVNGSFHASTADYVRLGSDGRFDASNPGNTTLSTAAPSAFGFLGAPAGISLDNSTLEVPEGETLTLVGGAIDMQDATLHAAAGHIHLASVASAGEAIITPDGLDTGDFNQLGTIEVRHTGNFYQRRLANLDTSGDSGGVISIRAGQFVMDNGYIFADNVDGEGGHVDIQTTETVVMRNEALATADTFGSGSNGRIEVNTVDLVLQDGGVIQVDNYGPGDGGTLTVNATGSVSIAGESPDELPYIGGIKAGLYAGSFGDGTGGTIDINSPVVNIGASGKIELNASFGITAADAGTLNLHADSLNMTDGAIIQTNTFSSGDAGTVNIIVEDARLTGGSNIAATTRGTGSGGTITLTATDSITISGSNEVGPSGIFTNTFDAGNGGSVSVSAGQLTVADGGAIQSAASGEAATTATTAGSINIEVNSLALSGQGQISTQSENAAQAGSINIRTAQQISIHSVDETVQSGVFSTTTGTGNGGAITLAASSLDMDGGAVNVSSNNAGNAGTIAMQLGTLNLRNGAQISTSVAGSGNGGDLGIDASGSASISGRSDSGFSSGLYSTTSDSGTGGNIDLAAHSVRINNQGLITAESTGSGDAGNINITAADAVNMEGGFIRTRAVTADGGNIDISAPDTVYLLNSEITTSVESGFGDGGNITIDPEFVILNNSRIVANAYGGDGGNILIVTDNFIASPDSIVDASSQFGLDGTVIIKSPEADLSSGLTELPESFLDVSALLREPCAARRSVNQSSFIVRGRSAIPPGPMASMPLVGLPVGSLQGSTVPRPAAHTTALSADTGIRLTGLSGAHVLMAGLTGCSL